MKLRIVEKMVTVVTIGLVCSASHAERNYQKALQMSNYFFQCQESGTLSPGNRCPWRGPAHTKDGHEVGRDLSGGWYDAGDHWKSNYTMAKSATMLAWSAIEFSSAYTEADQMDELLNNLNHVCDYFMKCVSDPAPNDTDSYDSYEVYVDVGGKPGPAPGVHSNWASPEAIEGYTVREPLKSTNTYPAADVEPLMAAAMSASAVVFKEFGDSELRNYAEELVAVARKLCIHTDRYFDNFSANTVVNGECLAVAPDGNARKIGYRDTDPYASTILGFSWLHRAETALGTSGYDDRFGKRALSFEQKMRDAGGSHYSWWSASSPKYAMFALLTSGVSIPSEAKNRMENAVNKTVDTWVETNPSDPNGVVVSPGGFHYRKNATTHFTISRMLNPSALAVFNAKYRTSKSNVYLEYIKSQVDYVLGDNPLNKSYMIGYDNDGSGDYLTVVHHRGAYGAWRSFEHFVSSKPFYRPNEVRHVLHGGVLLGNNAPEDTHREEVMHHEHTEVALYANGYLQSMLAALIAAGHGTGSPIDDNSFPPEAQRNDNTDLYTTDREFFVIAKIVSDGGSTLKIEAELHNRTRWPARRTGNMSFRYYLKPDGNTEEADLAASVISSNVTAEITGPVFTENCDPYIEISFPDNTIAPFAAGNCTEWCNYHKVNFQIGTTGGSAWDRTNDWSNEGLETEQALLTRFPVYQDGTLVGGEPPQCDITEAGPKFASKAPATGGLSVLRTNHGLVLQGLHPNASIEIFDMKGRMPTNGNADTNGRFRFSEARKLPKGTYLVRMSNEEVVRLTPVLIAE